MRITRTTLFVSRKRLVTQRVTKTVSTCPRQVQVLICEQVGHHPYFSFGQVNALKINFKKRGLLTGFSET